jgi:hypothetical protein
MPGRQLIRCRAVKHGYEIAFCQIRARNVGHVFWLITILIHRHGNPALNHDGYFREAIQTDVVRMTKYTGEPRYVKCWTSEKQWLRPASLSEHALVCASPLLDERTYLYLVCECGQRLSVQVPVRLGNLGVCQRTTSAVELLIVVKHTAEGSSLAWGPASASSSALLGRSMMPSTTTWLT